MYYNRVCWSLFVSSDRSSLCYDVLLHVTKKRKCFQILERNHVLRRPCLQGGDIIYQVNVCVHGSGGGGGAFQWEGRPAVNMLEYWTSHQYNVSTKAILLLWGLLAKFVEHWNLKQIYRVRFFHWYPPPPPQRQKTVSLPLIQYTGFFQWASC